MYLMKIKALINWNSITQGVWDLANRVCTLEVSRSVATRKDAQLCLSIKFGRNVGKMVFISSPNRPVGAPLFYFQLEMYANKKRVYPFLISLLVSEILQKNVFLEATLSPHYVP